MRRSRSHDLCFGSPAEVPLSHEVVLAACHRSSLAPARADQQKELDV